MANLAIDIGNTRIKAACFDGQKMLSVEVFSAETTPAEVYAFAQPFGADAAIISSVAASVAPWIVQRPSGLTVTELTTDLALPFVNTYSTPHTLGKDRLAAVAGAQSFFPSSACIVVDCGTCIKYEVLHADGRYLGGNISPGLHMRTRAMHAFTARLPEVPMYLPERMIGNNTTTALQNGAFGGALLEINAFIEQFEGILGERVRVLLTGGDAAWIQPRLSCSNLTIVPYLTLIGLNHILIHNQK